MVRSLAKMGGLQAGRDSSAEPVVTLSAAERRSSSGILHKVSAADEIVVNKERSDPSSVVPMTILNSHFSNLKSEKSIRKLVEIQIALGSQYLGERRKDTL